MVQANYIKSILDQYGVTQSTLADEWSKTSGKQKYQANIPRILNSEDGIDSVSFIRAVSNLTKIKVNDLLNELSVKDQQILYHLTDPKAEYKKDNINIPITNMRSAASALMTAYNPTDEIEGAVSIPSNWVRPGTHKIAEVTGESDMSQLQPEHFVDKYIDFSSFKSKKLQKIPLHPKAYELAKSYSFKFPKYTLQYKNRDIKEICKKAKIDTKIETVHYSSGNRTVKLRPKWELISSHTARRSFGRVFMEATNDIEKLRELLGHTSADTTRIYIGWEPEEIAEAVNRVQF